MTSKNIVVLEEINGDIDLLKSKLKTAGIKVTKPRNSTEYRITIPDSVQVVVAGNFLNYSSRSNVAAELIHRRNKEILGIVSAIAKDDNAVVILGTNELDAAQIIKRDDIETHTPKPEIAETILRNSHNRLFNLAGYIRVDDGITADSGVYDRRRGFELFKDFVITSGGMTFQLWKNIGMPQSAVEVTRRLNSDLYKAALELLNTEPEKRARILVPETLSASKYVQRVGYSHIPSPATTHTHELQNDWDNVWCPNPHFGQFRSNMSIYVDKSKFSGREFSYEKFKFGSNIEYPAIIARLSPIISLNPRDRVANGVDYGLIHFKGAISNGINRTLLTRA